MKLNNHALPVLRAVIWVLALNGAISLAYRNAMPRNPTGKKSEYMKMNAPAVPTAFRSFVPGEEVPAMMAMQVPMPRAETIMSLRRPKRSTVRIPMGEQIVCQVKTQAEIMRAVSAERPRLVWKMSVW